MAGHERTYEQFESDMRAEGYDDVLVREWQPGQVLDEHCHPFTVKALVTRGEVWLTEGAQVRHLKAGDGFELAHEVPHAERYGDQGATFWVARRNAV
jgi:hypothetical protein